MYLLVMVLWILLNGSVTWEIILLGLGLTAAIGLAAFLLWGYGPKKELRIYSRLPLFAAYLVVLLYSILKANYSVLRLILSPGRIQPALVRVEVDLKTEMARYILANSITLTPGTITVLSEGNTLTVHCLRRELLGDLSESVFVRLLRKMEA